ncbi:hypothetical protein [Streptomyces sp. S1D4-20]|uniref:hypothetical protein n=1 Tax=Streptomyces sp. S1D4-20 TaxID=2594462 RepID=UPI001164D69F|nr:hypothetical protein [Streptomyces sp. S1D4-20]QDN57345.1 hypothetical protein FNV67_20175 [Streptomyces sp. S1D4-20]
MTTPQQYQAPSADDFLMGGGVPSAKFPAVGHTVSGRITEKPTVEQQRNYEDDKLKFWDDGKPMMQLVVTLATSERDPENPEDDGTRRLYVKGYMKNAVASAVRSAGARGLEVGGILTVTYSGDGEKKNAKFNAPKLFTAQYVAAAAAELHTPDPGTAQQAMPQQQYAAPPVQQYAPAPVAQVPGLTPEQLQAAMANPATAALLAQQQAATAAGHVQQPTAPGDVPAF